MINPLVDNEKRWAEAKKDINFDFGVTECFCQLCYLPTNEPSKNEPPNIWCENLHIWKQQYFPCCCRHFCDAKKNLVDELGPCDCPRCCVCQTTNTRCETCKNKTNTYIFCSHIKHDHEPCLFQAQLWNKLNEEIDFASEDFIQKDNELQFTFENDTHSISSTSNLEEKPEVAMVNDAVDEVASADSSDVHKTKKY